MRFLHSSDWHLGKTLCHASLLDDQAHALDQVGAMVRETRAEALVIAGDIYDRAVPPKEAVGLLDLALERIVRGLGVPVLLIAGNHDSPERLGFASGFLGTQGLHVAGPLDAEAGPVRVGNAAFHLLPYADPASARHALGREDLRTHQEALAAQLALAQARHPQGHRFVAPALFSACDYAALGHLHRPQEAGRPQVRYAGSLLKYSASEAGHVKALTLVELPDQGPARTEPLPLTPRRDLRRLRGRFEDLLATPHGPVDDYLFLELLDEGPVLDAMARLRQVYPNLLGVQPAAQGHPTSPDVVDVSRPDLDPEALFRAFFQETQGRAMTDEETAIFRDVAARAAAEEADA